MPPDPPRATAFRCCLSEPPFLKSWMRPSPVGKGPIVTQLLKGLFSSRPPEPRYSHKWNETLVTKYLASLGSNKGLSLKKLSLKLAMLFALAFSKP